MTHSDFVIYDNPAEKTAWLVRKDLAPRVLGIEKRGAASKLRLQTTDQAGYAFVSFIGVHSPHAPEEFQQHLQDAKTLASKKEKRQVALWMGDFNVNMMKTRENDKVARKETIEQHKNAEGIYVQ